MDTDRFIEPLDDVDGNETFSIADIDEALSVETADELKVIELCTVLERRLGLVLVGAEAAKDVPESTAEVPCCVLVTEFLELDDFVQLVVRPVLRGDRDDMGLVRLAAVAVDRRVGETALIAPPLDNEESSLLVGDVKRLDWVLLLLDSIRVGLLVDDIDRLYLAVPLLDAMKVDRLVDKVGRSDFAVPLLDS